jgi:hypothetical protein
MKAAGSPGAAYECRTIRSPPALEDAGVPASFVTGDEVYGADPTLRAALEQRRVGYVLAVACNHRVPVPSGSERADEIIARLPRRSWQQRSAGNGTKGPRLYSWALVKIIRVRLFWRDLMRLLERRR